MNDCDVCYPPYDTVQLGFYCLPDPQKALDTFSTVLTAFGAIGASADGSLNVTVSVHAACYLLTRPSLALLLLRPLLRLGLLPVCPPRRLPLPRPAHRSSTRCANSSPRLLT